MKLHMELRLVDLLMKKFFLRIFNLIFFLLESSTPLNEDCFLKSITTLPLVSLIQASFTFHSKGIFNQKLFLILSPYL